MGRTTRIHNKMAIFLSDIHKKKNMYQLTRPLLSKLTRVPPSGHRMPNGVGIDLLSKDLHSSTRGPPRYFIPTFGTKKRFFLLRSRFVGDTTEKKATGRARQHELQDVVTIGEHS
jgi:hypothetical protein